MEVPGMDRGCVGNGCGPNRRIGHGYDTDRMNACATQMISIAGVLSKGPFHQMALKIPFKLYS